MTKSLSLILLAFSTCLVAKELPQPTTPNPGLKYYYPVPKIAEPKAYDFDVVIYGASPAAVSAACQAKKMGKTAAIFVFRRHVGGMSSSGLSDVDYGKKESIGGMAKTVFLDFFKKQVQSPAEVETLFLTMLTELDVPVFFEHRLAQVEKQGDRLTKLVFENGNSARGKVFLDTTYEGDLMARTGVSQVAGREANADFGEKLNGIQIGARSAPHNFQWRVDPYVVPGDPRSGVIEGVDGTPYAAEDHGKADKRYQPFCFRVFATQKDPLPWPKPADYRAARYELLKRYVNAAPDSTWWNLIYSRGPLKLNEGDCNSAGPVSLDYVGGSFGAIILPGLNAHTYPVVPWRLSNYGPGAGVSDHFPVKAEFVLRTEAGASPLTRPELAPTLGLPAFPAELDRSKLRDAKTLPTLSPEQITKSIGELYLLEGICGGGAKPSIIIGDTRYAVYVPDPKLLQAVKAIKKGVAVKWVGQLNFYKGSLEFAIVSPDWIKAR